MKTLILYFLWITFASLAVAAEPKLWADGKITPEQPFSCKVIGSIPSWGGAVIILKEDGENGRYCIADLIMHSFTYRIVDTESFDRKEWIQKGATFIEPSSEVERFSWSMGVHKVGRIFGEQDFVRQWYAESKQKSEQDADGNSLRAE